MNYNQKNYFQEKKKSKSFSVVLIFVKLIPYFLITAVIIGLIFIVAGLISFAPHYDSLKNVYNLAEQGKYHLTQAEGLIKNKDFVNSLNNLKQAQLDFQAADQELKKIKIAKVFQYSYFGEQVAVVDNILIISQETTKTLIKVNELGLDFLGFLDENITLQNLKSDQKLKILAKLVEEKNELKKLDKNLNLIEKILLELKKQKPSFLIEDAVFEVIKKVPAVIKIVEDLQTSSELIPELVGYPEEKTYLVLLENNTELRPAGGFIGTYGILKMHNAEISKFSTHGILTLDIPSAEYLKEEPPYPIKEYMNVPYWFMRDANWWPDFATSAEKVEWFYHQEGGVEDKIDAVIAVTPNFFIDLLGLLGNINVQGINFTPENFLDELEYEVEIGFREKDISSSQRKAIIGDLGLEMQKRLFNLNLLDLVKVKDIVLDNLTEKQILLYFKNQLVQDYFKEKDWIGEVKAVDHDYLMVVDANMAALKTDLVMDRAIEYELFYDEKDNLFAEVKVNYKNSGGFSWKTGRYRSYTRVYTPLGSKILEVKAGNKVIEKVDSFVEHGKQTFGAFFTVDPKSSKTVTWRYQLPKKIKEQIEKGDYKILVQKQSGLLRSPDLNFNLKFQQDLKLYKLNKQSLQNLQFKTKLEKDELYLVELVPKL